MSERDELVARMRAQRDHADDWRTTLAEKAADLLERDGAELARLRAENKRLTRERDDPGTTHADGCASWGPKHYACAIARIAELEAEVARLTTELRRIQRLPELEWAEACSRIFQVLASAARAGFPVRDSVAVAAMDAGKTYVDRILAERDAALARAEAAELDAARYRMWRTLWTNATAHAAAIAVIAEADTEAQLDAAIDAAIVWQSNG